MIVLGIESSCDETAAALVDERGEVFADVVATQIQEHAPYGGVVPELAARAHLRNIVPVVQRALSALPGGLADVEGIAVTRGPGLVGALLVGLQVAKAMASSSGLPIVGVDHLEGHLLAVHLQRGQPIPQYPYVALLASGGHTALYRVDSPSSIELLGQTRDDAAGEAYDKTAKAIGLGYPGGPIIDRLAALGDDRAIDFPLPMVRGDDIDFSFSGLKTAVARHVRSHGIPATEDEQANLCASFQRVLVQSLARKSVLACRREGIARLVLTGGVAANRGLRERARVLCEEAGIELFVPPIASCTDNAAMIAFAGAQRLVHGEHDQDLVAYSRDPRRRRGRFRADGSLIPRRA